MFKEALVNWRKSASLIILCKDNAGKTFDYNALLFTRPERASFMPKSAVFPGGVCESADDSSHWLNYFHGFGVHADKLKALVERKDLRPNTIQATHGEEYLHKAISTRITAIRETFEEVGVFLCRDRHNLSDASGYGCVREDFDRVHWQHLVHNDPTQFLTLCKELDVVPDLWSLHEWSAWMTPSTFKKRFETAFFIVALKNKPTLLLEQTEVASCAWRTPKDYIEAYLNKELYLPPPQFYELSRLLNITKLEELREFAYQREIKGTTLLLPVLYQCSDGKVSLLPGDDMYPADPNASDDFIATNMSMEQFRAGARNLHRAENGNLNNVKYHLNFPSPDGHLQPVNVLNVKL